MRRRALKRKPNRSLRFSVVTSSFANLCSVSCCSHGGSLSSSAHWQLIWHGPLNKWTHILPHDDAILYSKYYNYCFCLLIYILQHYYPIKTREGFDCIQGGRKHQWSRYVLPPNKNWWSSITWLSCTDYRQTINRQSSYILRRPSNFAKSSPYIWLALHRTKVKNSHNFVTFSEYMNFNNV